MIDALITSYRLKDEVRAGWQLRGVVDPESVADHSWGTAYLVLLHAEDAGVSRLRALEIALVHDLAEAITGDVPTRMAGIGQAHRKEEKARRELEAMTGLLAGYGPLEAARVYDLWTEYEENRSNEARFVRDMNLVDMCIQACVYERDRRYDPDGPNPRFPDYGRLDEFFATAKARVQTPLGRSLLSDVARRYEQISRKDGADES